MRPILIIGGGGLLLYYLYSKGYFGGTSAVIPVGTGTGTGTGTSTGTGTGTGTSTTPGFNSLAAIYQRLIADAGANAQQNGLTADGWNFSLARVAAVTPPDPDVVFPNQDRNMKITAATYWSTVAPYLTTNFGLSGLRGLGSYGNPWNA